MLKKIHTWIESLPNGYYRSADEDGIVLIQRFDPDEDDWITVETLSVLASKAFTEHAHFSEGMQAQVWELMLEKSRRAF